MKRYYPSIDWYLGEASATMEPDPDGLYVLASEAQDLITALVGTHREEVDCLRGLIEAAYREGLHTGTFTIDDHPDEMWERSDARKSLTPPAPTHNP